MAVATINDLPSEILFYIFHQLDGRGAKNIGRTCRLFHEIIRRKEFDLARNPILSNERVKKYIRIHHATEFSIKEKLQLIANSDGILLEGQKPLLQQIYIDSLRGEGSTWDDVKTLLKLGCKVDCKDKFKNPLIHKAVFPRNIHPTGIKLLLKYQDRVSDTPPNLNDLLNHLLRGPGKRDRTLIQSFVFHGANIERKDLLSPVLSVRGVDRKKIISTLTQAFAYRKGREQFLETCPQTLKCRLTRTYFYGEIKEETAKAILKRTKPGTYIAYNPKEEADSLTVIVSYVSDVGSIRSSKFSYDIIKNAFTMDGTDLQFPTLEAIIKEFKIKYRRPLDWRSCALPEGINPINL